MLYFLLNKYNWGVSTLSHETKNLPYKNLLSRSVSVLSLYPDDWWVCFGSLEAKNLAQKIGSLKKSGWEFRPQIYIINILYSFIISLSLCVSFVGLLPTLSFFFSDYNCFCICVMCIVKFSRNFLVMISLFIFLPPCFSVAISLYFEENFNWFIKRRLH